jgi:hypothetical protein
MTTLSTNGRSERKSLASQLDRLDRILDGLADGLNEAVATAVKEAVVVAVEAAVRELLASAELQRRLRTEPAGRPGLVRRAATALGRRLLSAARGCWSWVTAVTGRGRHKAAQAVAALREGGEALAGRAGRGMSALARHMWLAGFVVWSLARRFRKPLLVALACGLVSGLGCYLAGPAVASIVSGLAGFAGSLAASALDRLRRILDRAELRQRYLGRLP